MIKTILILLGRLFLSLRYRVEIRGLDQFKERKGILILPNHTAHTDPLILFTWLWPKFKMRPLVVESIFRLPVLRSLLPFLNTVVIPDFETSLNQYKLKKAEKALEQIIEGLKQGDNFVVYPSGKFKGQGKEIVGGASGAHEIVQQLGDGHVLLVRMTGFWGSSFSKAITGSSPEFFKVAIGSLKVLLKNLIFFAPRRRIVIDLQFDPVDLPRSGKRQEFNRYLEKWYNRYQDEEGNIHESEPLTLVPNQFWSGKVLELSKQEKLIHKKTSSTIQESQEKIFKELRKILDSPKLAITPEMTLGTDLGMDSLNLAELVAYLSQNYDIGEITPGDLDTVQTILEIANGTFPMRVKETAGPSHHWPEESSRPALEDPVGKTFPEAFLNICKRMGSLAAIGDDLAGVLSYKKCKTSALVLAQYFKTFPEERIAVMLPSSAGTMVVILALHFAKKVPVMLNWTLGPKYLEEMMRLSDAQKVLTSWRFVERLNHVDFGTLCDQILFLEDIRLNISLPMKLKGVFLAHCPSSFVLKSLLVNEDQFAVILFSSGTESAPKGIPLSHKNVLASIRASLWNFNEVLTAQDVVYGILPCFHSFGFTIAGFLGLLSGMRVAFYPKPTDSLKVAEGIKRWKVTCLPIVPSLLKRLFQVAKEDQLTGVRFFITAGEKTAAELFEKVKKINPNAELVEGYGLTETSPTLTIMLPHLPPKGVGQLLPGVEAVTIHHETKELLPFGSEGEICVRGPNIFQGYLGSTPSPFIELDGKSWFRTGDIGYIEPDQTLILTGRIKRFVKLGGEMVSLGAIEEALLKACAKNNLIPNDLPCLAVGSLERESDNPKLVVFTTFPIEKETLNQFLREAGFSNLVKLSFVRQVEEIPLFGTGKINYRNLQQLIDLSCDRT